MLFWSRVDGLDSEFELFGPRILRIKEPLEFAMRISSAIWV